MSIAIDLHDRVTLVTGAAGGLGAACAERFAEAGATVVLTDVDGPGLEQVRDHIGPSATARTADLTSGEACSTLVRDVVAEHGRIDHLVACAGVMQSKPLLELTEDEWRRMLDVNLTGTFLLLREVAAEMATTGGGSVVLLSSVAARSGRPLAAHYAASKSALVSLTRSSAMAFAPDIRVNALCPGVVLTRMWDAIIADRDVAHGPGAGDAYRQQVERAAPLGRSGTATEIANAALFLASDLASFITGQALNVDGGLEMD